MDPFNYTIQTANPFDSVIKGYQAGIGINQVQQAQAQQQQAQALQQQKAAVIQSLISNPNPTADDYAKATLVVPELHEQFKQSWETRNSAQNQSRLNDLTQWSAAIQNGQPQIAVDAMNTRAQALEDAAGGPTPESKAMKANAQVVQEHPEFANNAIIKPMIFAHPDGKKVIESIAALNTDKRAEQLQPGLVDKGIADASMAQADAVKANAAAQVAQATVPALTEKAALDNRLAELDRQIAAANSETQRGQLQLERDKLVQQQAQQTQTAGQEAQGHLDSTQQAIDSVDRLLKDPLLESSFGVGSSFGKLLSFIPGTENKDFRAQVETLKAQLFIPAVAQLKAAGAGGALSDAEGKKLDASVASLDADQSPKAFKNNLGIVKTLLTKALQKVLANPKLPQTGGGYVIKHPQYGTVREGDISRLLVQFPGTTREQVIQYLNSTGGTQ